MNQPLGKLLIIAGVCAVIAGILILNIDRLPLLKYLGRLPGDINVKRGNFSFHFPIVTCIILSIIATIVFRIISRYRQ